MFHMKAQFSAAKLEANMALTEKDLIELRNERHAEWLDEHRAKTLVPDFSSDAFNKQAEQEILRAGLIGPRDRN